MDPLSVSIVIPVYNGGPDLEKCLEAIKASSYPVFECIVVDDGSSDGMAARMAELHDIRLITLQEQRGPAHARNLGVEAAVGDIIFFIDADVLVHPDTLAVAARILKSEPETAAVFGSYDDQPEHPSFLSQYRNLFHHWTHQNSQHDASTFWTGCGAIRKEVFVKMGGLETNYQRPSIEDVELGSRMRRSGYHIRLEKTMLCTHMKQWKFWNLLKTDVFRRGVPWVLLLLRNRDVPSDLNLSNNSRLATLLAGILALAVLALLLTGHAVAVIPAAAFLTLAASGALFSGKRGSGLLLTLTVLATLAATIFVADSLAAIPLILILLLVWTHHAFYRYVAKKRSIAFALAVVPQQVIFFLGCAVSGVIGLINYFLGAGREPAAR